MSRIGPLANQADETFGYDSVGNRLNRDPASFTSSGAGGQPVNSTFNPANRLLNDTTFTYTYDNNGNLVTKTHVATSQVTSYVYDAENQLIQITRPDGLVANYRYDGLGRRIEKSAVSGLSSAVVRYVYDNEDIALEFAGSPSSPLNTLTAGYVHGPGIDEPLLMTRIDPIVGAQSYFYHSDGLGSVTDLTNTTGTIAQSYVYDSFGNIVTQTGTLPAGISNPYTYTGREFDAESGLFYYRARYYDPAAGRFISPDPSLTPSNRQDTLFIRADQSDDPQDFKDNS